MVKTVELFVTCLVDTFRPQVGEAVVNVLKRAGVTVHFSPEQTCCGQPAFNVGMRPEARAMAKQSIELLEKSPHPVVIPSGSCTNMVRHGFLELFREDPVWLKRAEALSTRTFEFSEFLVDVLDLNDIGAHFPEKIAYHPSCHLLRGVGVDHQPRLLLRSIEGVEIVDLPEEDVCCGFGGLFSIEHPELSGEMLANKIASIESCGANTIVTCDTGCLMQIYGGLIKLGKTQKVMHIAEVLDSNR